VIEFLPLDEIAPYKRNPRTHSKEQVERLAASLLEYGWTNPELVDEDRGLIAGHGRVLAARAVYKRGQTLRMASGSEIPKGCVPVLYARGWSDAQKRAYVIADNKLALDAGWDEALLKIELEELKALDFNLELTGFALPELDGLFGGGEDAGRTPSLGNLADRFLVAPFSVLNAREGWWQDRKRAWLALGIQSELGRGENALGFSETVLQPDPEKRKGRRRANAEPAGGGGGGGAGPTTTASRPSAGPG
jgi:ParB-like chromosome segregation protein Spo0J